VRKRKTANKWRERKKIEKKDRKRKWGKEREKKDSKYEWEIDNVISEVESRVNQFASGL
jgi:hypothetical protein